MNAKTILIADDEPAIVKLVTAVLTSNGYDVLEATGGFEALQLAAKHPGPIDLVLADVKMPGLSGPDLCERLHARRPQTRYLLMSGYAESLETLGFAFLAKPFNIAALLRSVRMALDAAPELGGRECNAPHYTS